MKLKLLESRGLRATEEMIKISREFSKKLVDIYDDFMEAVNDEKNKNKHISYNIGKATFTNPIKNETIDIFIDIAYDPNTNDQARHLYLLDSVIEIIAPRKELNLTSYYQPLIIHELLHEIDPNRELRNKKDFRRLIKGKYKQENPQSYNNYISKENEFRVWLGEMCTFINAILVKNKDNEHYTEIRKNVIDMLNSKEIAPWLAYRYKDAIRIWKKSPGLWKKVQLAVSRALET